jgi:phenylacetate-CoA ligase
VNRSLMKLYHHLPSAARPLAATLRGLYLRWWRYGPSTGRLIREAEEREYWTPAQWQAYREERLAYVLHRAASEVPYYRAHWQARRGRGDRASWELLGNWPVLEKHVLREQAERFIADGCNPRRMFFQQTSGTTGTPIRQWRSRPALRALYALAAARTRGWSGISERERRARLGGQVVVPIERRRPPFWVWNAAQHQLYLSTFHLAPDLLHGYLDALRDYGVVCLMGYPSSIQLLAEAALQSDRRDLNIRAVITSAEPLLPRQREMIEKGFRCQVQETYGMVENVAAASSCEEQQLHQWPEVGVVEVLDGSEPLPAGEVGDLVCTGLLELDMPLIRYRVGDRGMLPTDQTPCACGRTLPGLGQVQGRSNDMLLTPDGRRVFWLNPVLYGAPVREAQIVQETLDRIRLSYVPADGFTSEWSRRLAERVRERMGDVEVTLDPVERVPRSVNGKLQMVRCELSDEERASVLERTHLSRGSEVRAS